MSKIHQPTKVEYIVHNWLKGKHIKHKMYPKIDGNPDIYLKDANIFVFVDGCFWHCCPIHYKRPKSKQEFWIPHIEGSNEKREKIRKTLKYKWIRIWEHDIRNNMFKKTLSSIFFNPK